MENQVYNFCAGPAALPRAVLERAQEELLDWQDLGISVMEISHRSPEFQQVADTAEADLRKLLSISDDYAVLFMHGGASHQFAQIPMNFLQQQDGTAEYITTGIWSEKAAKEAARFGKVHSIDALATESGFDIVEESSWTTTSQPVYRHFCPNETIGGVEFNWLPKTDAPLIADMSSCILSKTIDVNDYALIYAGAQKNIGPAGISVVIARRDFIRAANVDHIPALFQYQLMDEHGSMYNTPPTFGWYLAGLVFEWLLEQGGVKAIEALNQQKSEMLYQFIDGNDFYHNPVAPAVRSRMNVPFILADESLNQTFLDEAQAAGLVGLKGHRSVGGMRASIYNAMPLEGVEALLSFMKDFSQRRA